jgi:predicted AlkP superfamily phosphohydrolase/phosphomutase
VSQTTTHGNRFRRECTHGLLGGTLAGLVVGVATWRYAGSIGEGGLSFAANTGVGGFVSTLAHAAVSHAIFGVLVGLVVALLLTIFRRYAPRWLTAALTLAGSIFGFVFVRVLAERNLSLPAYVPLGHPMRSALLRSSLLAGLGWGVAALVIGVLVFMGLRSKAFRRTLTAVFLLCVLVTAIGVVRVNLPRARSEAFGSLSDLPEIPGKVVVIGLDGATWQLLDSFSREGLLPNIDRLRAEGVSANLVTHGRRISPAVWTGMATGWSHRQHGVNGFTVLDPRTGQSRIVTSGDRKKAAVWQVASEFGRSHAVINWWASYPAERTNGVIVSRIVDMDAPSVNPPEMLPDVMAIVDSSRERNEARGEGMIEIETVFDLADSFMGEDQPDLVMLYLRETDKAQHVFWAAEEPGEFDETWDVVTDEYIERGRRALRDIWSTVDQRVGQLVELAGDNTTVLIVSDHGFKPRSAPLVMLNMNALLDAMGYATLVDPVRGTVDPAMSRAFAATTDASESVLGVFVNEAAQHEGGIVMPDSVATLEARLASELSELRVEETGQPLFRSVGVVPEGATSKLAKIGADIYAEKGDAIRLAGKGRTVEVGGVKRELDELLVIHAKNTGNHDPRAVFLGVGPGLRKGVVLPLVSESPYTRALNYVTGYEKRLEGFYRLMRGIGTLDQYTSIDIAPTLLYLVGLPSSAKMEGRLMSRLMSPELLKRRPVVLVDDFEYLREAGRDSQDEGTLSEQTLEQLRTLGYLQ